MYQEAVFLESTSGVGLRSWLAIHLLIYCSILVLKPLEVYKTLSKIKMNSSFFKNDLPDPLFLDILFSKLDLSGNSFCDKGSIPAGLPFLQLQISP